MTVLYAIRCDWVVDISVVLIGGESAIMLGDTWELVSGAGVAPDLLCPELAQTAVFHGHRH